METAIVIFVYNRPEHTEQTLTNLEKNISSDKYNVYIFSDGPKSHKDYEEVTKVREIINKRYNFKNIKVIERKKNMGLANSVIEGVTEVLNLYDSVIVLEDDLITSKYFLEFMNECLHKYRSNQTIWSISGFTPKLNIPEDYSDDIYLSRRAISWGWATWKDRWNEIDWDIKDYSTFINNRSSVKKFNLGGNDMTYMLKDQMEGRINSWAIRWGYNQFIQQKYTIVPVASLVQNIGLDFSGTHSSNSDRFKNEVSNSLPYIPDDIGLNSIILKEFKKKYNLSIKGYCGVLLRKIGLYSYTRKIIKLIRRFQ